ncbi:hypothetical protein [Evansella cellulosilytica]|uniref:Replicative DNA helicase n=1 Tax=Evansella cellulosilytica (strain ATCC 21833 / DSM 2522 / FERM P-1141 / JCM 9156 / N-4) TaxID=649639 RepID=E6TQY0_EVAC2|nr:hypothetical protein [Evansella cellulosilytica]ADU29356.1 hypothetical protein Bcell_1086 [Evansella cellulosilytica DSM 2522]
MEKLDLLEISSGYQERMRRLALFDALYELERKREQDQNNNVIDMKGLGLLTLLFFFEKKLMRQYKTGAMQLAYFIEELTKQKYKLDKSTYEKMARTIIQTFRPASGKKRSYSYFNWEKMKDEMIEYSILKANSFDVKTNTQYYTLDEDGLELVFATKEFYSEFQLSINQLLLRKQLDKGEFKGALRQINEMRIDVETLEERMIKLRHEIQRSIVSEETFERYKQLLEDIYSRLAREDEEFKELREFVKETKDRLFSKDIHKKEKKTYELILKINNELEKVHYDHSRLLDQTFKLKETTLITAQESLYYTGIQSFNFEHDIVSKITSSPLPIEAMIGILHPFLKVEETKMWSPLSILEEQNIIDDREDRPDDNLMELKDEEDTDKFRKKMAVKFKELMELFLTAFENNRAERLSSFMEYLIENKQEEVLKQRYFYDFWLILHQRSPIKMGDFEEEDGAQTILGDSLYLLGERKLTIEEEPGTIQKTARFSIQEMIIRLEGETNEIF